MENLLFAFSLTLLAGLSTGIGSTISFFTKKINTNFLSIALGFSAGVMIYISLTELLTESKSILQPFYKNVDLVILLSFFGGIIITGLIDLLIPNLE